jgi:hypothetical protein
LTVEVVRFALSMSVLFALFDSGTISVQFHTLKLSIKLAMEAESALRYLQKESRA